MEIKKIFLAGIFIVSLFVFAACSDDDDNGNGKKMTYLPEKITLGNENTLYFSEDKYTYDNSNRIVEINSKVRLSLDEEKISTHKMKIDYDTEGRVVSIENYSAYFKDGKEDDETRYTQKFSYEGNVVISEDGWKFELDKKGYLKKLFQNMTDAEGNPLEVIIICEYDERGNLIKIPDSSSYISEFDDENGIFKHVNTPQWMLWYKLNQRNIVNNLVEVKIDDSNCENTFAISYNQDRYPVEIVQSNTCADLLATVTKIEYIKK